MHNIEIRFEDLILNYRKERVFVTKEANRYGKGSLRVCSSDGHRRYYREYRQDGRVIRRGITKDAFQVRCLARKLFLEELIRRYDRNLAALESIRDRIVSTEAPDVLRAVSNEAFHLPAEAFLCTPARREGTDALNPTADESIAICPAMTRLPDETDLAEWKRLPYRMNTKNAENKRQRLPDGLAVRSKSEASLIQLYEKLRIPYHYDELLRINGHVVSPDIIGIRRDRTVILHEHCGLTENETYMNEHNWKIALYESAGFVPWKNLIVTYETEGGGIDLALAEALIRNRYEL